MSPGAAARRCGTFWGHTSCCGTQKSPKSARSDAWRGSSSCIPPWHGSPRTGRVGVRVPQFPRHGRSPQPGTALAIPGPSAPSIVAGRAKPRNHGQRLRRLFPAPVQSSQGNCLIGLRAASETRLLAPERGAGAAMGCSCPAGDPQLVWGAGGWDGGFGSRGGGSDLCAPPWDVAWGDGGGFGILGDLGWGCLEDGSITKGGASQRGEQHKGGSIPKRGSIPKGLESQEGSIPRGNASQKGEHPKGGSIPKVEATPKWKQPQRGSIPRRGASRGDIPRARAPPGWGHPQRGAAQPPGEQQEPSPGPRRLRSQSPGWKF